MIVLSLQCVQGHPFEGWFGSTEAFDDQARTKLVACPMCGTTDVSRLPSAPRVKKGSTREAADTRVAEMYRALTETASKSEDVGDRFPEEARRMHYGEASVRNIKGQATLSEAKGLVEEGIPVLPLPAASRGDTH